MQPEASPMFSRESVLGGLPARRASTLLFAIESRTAILSLRARTAMARFETERTAADREGLLLAALAGGRAQAVHLTIQDLDRHARHWADLVPPDPELRAAVLSRIIEKYRLPSRAGQLRSVLGAHDAAVENAYRRQTGHGLEEADTRSDPMPLRERVRWWRASASRRLEGLPPFWLAYALTLTETVGGGALALPIAFAKFGAIGATITLAVFGVVNALTIAAMVESITRNGSIRYGAAYFGRLIGDYLGRPGKSVALPALFALDAVGFMVALVGFGTTIGGVTGVPAVVCAAILFGGVAVILWRGSFNSTVALAVAVGLVNLGLITAIAILAAGVGPPAGAPAGQTGLVLDASLLEVMFGVALLAYFGHTSAGYAAKVVLARDPSGRQLLAGNVAAILTAMVIYIFFVLAVTAAVGQGTLAGYGGTALTPLAARVGPSVDVLGTIYVTLALGLSAVYLGLGIFHQMAEVTAGRRFTRRRGFRGGRLLDFAIRAAPLGVIFAVVEWLLDTGGISFTEPLNVVGTITLPLLGGVFPMLLLVASRRRGGRLPGWIIGPLGHPIVAILIGSLYLLAVVSFGLWIWHDPLERGVALFIGITIIALTAVTWRRGSFAPRTVVEYRVEAGPPALGMLSIVSAGRALAATIGIDETTGIRTVNASTAQINAPNRLRSVRVGLPEHASGELELWVHAVAADGTSTTTPTAVDLLVGGDLTTIQIDGQTNRPVVVPQGGGAAVLTISPVAASAGS
jgi:Transmembrane amino acid transporter protein